MAAAGSFRVTPRLSGGALIKEGVNVSADPAHQGEVLCVGTYLPLRRFRDIPAFLGMSGRVERLLHRSPGLLRYGVRAALFQRRFWTYSVWTDDAAVRAFVPAEPHATAMKRLAEWGARGSGFVRWRSTDHAVTWEEVFRRLAALKA